jgi:hypothetical protein
VRLVLITRDRGVEHRDIRRQHQRRDGATCRVHRPHPSSRAASLPALAPRGADEHPAPTVSLEPGEQAVFDGQLVAASAAAAGLATPDAAIAAGYVQSATQLPAVGTHFVNWSLVDQPFDPARPAMLLFDQGANHETRLAGLSYWVRSPSAPEGFVGPNDQWHRHSGMCFEDGWLREEGVADATQCGGQYLEGSDLWMLHVWVVPGYANGDGVFAARNTDLCPPDNAQLPDALKCSSPGNPVAPGSHDDPNAVTPAPSAYCHLPAT